MGVHQIPWVNKGEAFILGPKEFTPSDVKAIMAAKLAATKEHYAGLGGLGEAQRKASEAEAEKVVLLEVASAIVRRALVRVDPSLASMPADQLIDKLTTAEYKAILDDIKPAEAQGATPSANPPFTSGRPKPS